MTKQFSNYSDLLTFTRASNGHALRPVSYGDELVVNGTFDSASSWVANTNWTISGGVATLVGGDGVYGNSALYQLIDLDVGKIYRVSLDISGLTGTLRLYHASYSTGVVLASTGTLVVTLVGEAGGTRINILGESGSAATIDNVSIKEVTFDESDGTLTLFEHPNNVPRVEYDTDGNRLGLLVEESRTNLVRYSDLNLGWDDAATDIRVFNTATAPDKTFTATSFTCNSGGFLYDAITVTASTDYTFSWYTKAGTATAHVYAFYDESNSAFVEQTQYTLTDGEEVGDGWYRQSKTVTTPAGCTSIRIYPLRANDSTGVVAGAIGTTLIWGAQFEAGAFSTSFIETTGSTATRSADVASIPVADFGYNQSAGTVAITATPYDASSLGWYAAFGSSASDSIQFYSSTSKIRTFIRKAGVDQASFNSVDSASDNTEFSFAASFEKDNVQSTLNGGAIASDTSAEIPNITASLKIGANTLSGSQLNGHIKSIKYYPRRLSNAQLVQLTS